MYLLVVGLAMALVAGSDAEPGSPVNVTVYYESLCPDSIRFYTGQLFPTMNVANLSTKVSLELVPYGKSKHMQSENGSWVFECHHGERECYGNKVHACALKKLTSQKERLAYLNCLMEKMLKDRTIVFPAESCAEGIISKSEADEIISCANSTDSDLLLVAMGNKTQMLQPKLASVPTVVFNNKYEDNDFREAQTNFKGVLCKYLSPKPAECAGTSRSSTFAASLFLIISTFSIIFCQHY